MMNLRTGSAEAWGFSIVIVLAVGAPAQNLGSWETLAPMPNPRQEVGVAPLEGKIYVVGGFDGNETTVNAVERYDPAMDAWDSVADLPADEPVNHVGAAVSGGRLYVLGGLSQFFQPKGGVFCFNPESGEWSAKASMSRPRGASGVAEVDGLIYVAGGFPSAVNTAFSVYDPSTNQWTALAPMPTGRDHLAAAAVDGKIYAIGGRVSIDLREEVEVYDPSTRRWQTRARIPTPRAGIAAAAVHGRIYVFGGEGNANDPINGIFDEVEEYDPRRDRWRTLKPMPLGRHGIGAAVFAGKIHVPGGGPVQGLGTSMRNDVFTPPATPQGVLDFLLGVTGSDAGQDATADGVADIADLLWLVLNEE